MIKDNIKQVIKKGHVYWITGLSGAGKTTVGTKFYNCIKQQKNDVIKLDGDVLREIFQMFDYSREGRRNIGFQYSRLCKMISDQGIDVIICTIAMFEDLRKWNRKNLENYTEIYLEVSIEELIRRDQKGIYSKALKKGEENVSGINQEVELPKNPDIIIKNYNDITPEKACQIILERCFEK